MNSQLLIARHGLQRLLNLLIILLNKRFHAGASLPVMKLFGSVIDYLF